MIKLCVDDCCHNCPFFEVRVTRAEAFDGEFLTVIQCENTEKCRYLYNTIQKKIQKDALAALKNPHSCE